VAEQSERLDIRTPSIDANVAGLSGGNQPKAVLARALLADAKIVLADEPTAGVDVGARSEIYRILRDVADRGTPVVILSSDTLELEGLCDRVCVFSRGAVVGELLGADVTEENIGRTMIAATAHRRENVGNVKRAGGTSVRWSTRAWQFAAGDYAPSLVLAILIIVLGAYTTGYNARFTSAFNVQKILLLSAAFSFIGLGQACAIFTGGIDVSVGPLAGLTVVIGSFFFTDESTMFTMFAGLLVMFSAGTLIGLANGSLVRFGNFTAVAATLGVYVVIQGISVLLRPAPAGSISTDVIAAIQTNIGDVPVAFVLAVLLAIGLEFALRYSRWGLSLRAVGSNEDSATGIGVRTNSAIVAAFVACSVLTVLGGVMVMVQLGIGDANQGVGYTLSSIAAVVLGGASPAGGRGTFVAVVFGAALIQEVNSATSFLGLSEAWQYWFIGFLTLGAVAIYSQARRSAGDP
jgi:ribose transport system ATP-binding protein